jgi:flagellin-like protein
MNNKGLSGIVTTLIIILLTLVAIGIIWAVVSNLLSKSSGTVESSTKCLDVDIRATKVVENVAGNYTVTLKRSASGDDTEMCAKVVLYTATTNSPVLDFSDNCLTPLESASQTFGDITGNITSATKVEVTPYYIDSNNKEKLCTVTTTLEF